MWSGTCSTHLCVGQVERLQAGVLLQRFAQCLGPRIPDPCVAQVQAGKRTVGGQAVDNSVGTEW